MNLYLNFIKKTSIILSFSVSYLLFSFLPLSISANQSPHKNKAVQVKKQIYNKNLQNYILGSGDQLIIAFTSAIEFSSRYMIGPDGYLNFPDIGPVMASGFTINELEDILIKRFSESIIDPQVRILMAGYRPVKTLIVGEVERPGFYNLAGVNNVNFGALPQENNKDSNIIFNSASQASIELFPTLYDALRTAGGITLYSDLSDIEIIRKNTISNGGGKIRANVNLISLIKEGDQSQNIRIYDGDTIKINRSEEIIGKQIIEARKTNLNPREISVFVGGNVINPGKVIIPNGAGLNQAIEIAGGRRLFSGNIIFLRFDNDGSFKKRIIKYKQNKNINTRNNPLLAEGDIIQVKDSLLGRSTEAFTEISSPIVGAFGLYGLIEEIIE